MSEITTPSNNEYNSELSMLWTVGGVLVFAIIFFFPSASNDNEPMSEAAGTYVSAETLLEDGNERGLASPQSAKERAIEKERLRVEEVARKTQAAEQFLERLPSNSEPADSILGSHSGSVDFLGKK